MPYCYAHKKILIVGAGVTGLALCRFFAAKNARVTLTDQRPAEKIPGLDSLTGHGIALDLGGHTPAIFLASELIVISPGVSLDLPPLAAAIAAGVEVCGEIEIAGRELTAPMAAITGTNGKSTTTTLMAEIYRAWGKKTFAGGNLGTPLIEATAQPDWEMIVAEISSFQLEAVKTFHPRHALLLNLTEDHLDRYPSMADYVAAKLQIFARQEPTDYAILNAGDPLVWQHSAGLRSHKIYFSSQGPVENGMWLDADALVWQRPEGVDRFPVASLQLKGTHNLENIMAALLPPLLDGCPPDLAWATACAFSGLAHRMQVVRVRRGVTWYNDSKGTNVGSVVKSLEGLVAPVTLIAGGKDKGGDYAPLLPLVRDKVRHLVLIGEATEIIASALGTATTVHRATSMAEAVTMADRLTPAGSVLLSPGCSSFDMFSGYAERGNVFAAAVHSLPE